jgi:hypothetical protein
MDQQTRIMDQTFSLDELARLRALLQVVPTSTTPQMNPTSHPATVVPAPIPLFSQTPSQTMATQPLPITQLYQSSRQQSLPQGPITAPSSAMFQPYPGIGTLSLNLATGHANQACMASASASIPRQAQLPRQTSRRTRGPAQSAPVLPQSHKPVLSDCLATPTTIRLKFFVYPHRVSPF